MIKPILNKEKVIVVDPEGDDHWPNLTEYTLLLAKIKRLNESGWSVWIGDEDDGGFDGLHRISPEGYHQFAELLFKNFHDALFYLGNGKNQ